jgi:hypothetical protein
VDSGSPAPRPPLFVISDSMWSQAMSLLHARWNINSMDARSATLTHNMAPSTVQSRHFNRSASGRIPRRSASGRIPRRRLGDGVAVSRGLYVGVGVWLGDGFGIAQGLPASCGKAGGASDYCGKTGGTRRDPNCLTRHGEVEQLAFTESFTTSILPRIPEHIKIKRKSFSIIARSCGLKDRRQVVPQRVSVT